MQSVGFEEWGGQKLSHVLIRHHSRFKREGVNEKGLGDI